MNIQIDARGKQCPLPVIEAKNAIAGMKEAGTVEVTVDNEIAVQNLTKMANHKGLSARSEVLISLLICLLLPIPPMVLT